MRARLAGAKKSDTATVPAMIPRKRPVSRQRDERGPEAVKLLEELQKRGGRPGEEADLALKRMARK